MSRKVAVLIPTRGKVAFVRQCLTSLFASHNPDDLEVVVFEQGGEESKILIETKFADKPVTWHKSEEGWSYSQINNAAAAVTSAPYLLLLNNDTICRKGFLEEMLKVLDEHKDVGIVGAKLLHLDGTIQHVGVIFRSDGVPNHIGWGRKDDGTFLPATRDDYYDAVTFACVLIPRTLWDTLGGLDEAYFFNYEDVDFCLKAREAGYRAYVAHKAVVTHIESQSLESRKTKDHTVWRNLKILRDRWIDTGKVEKLCNVKIYSHRGTLRDERLNIAFMPAGKGSGVPWWRVELPARKLGKLQLANVVQLNEKTTQDQAMEILSHSDVVFTHCFSDPWILTLMQMGPARPYAIVYDCDDHPGVISPYAEAYRHFGCTEVRIKADDGSETWLWRDGQAGFDVNRNINTRSRQMEIIASSDVVTTTVPALHEFLSTLNPNVKMLPNCIDFDLFRPMGNLWKRKDRPIRIGWHGGDNHWHDISVIGKALVEYVNAHDVELVLFGAFYQGPLRGIDRSKVIEEEWTNPEAFPWKLATLGIDVAIVPLANPNLPMQAFNKYKSAIKWMEYAALKIPSLVSANVDPYEVAIDGETCLKFSGDKQFLDQLHRLCRDAGLRKNISEAAYDYVFANFNLEKNVHRWIDVANEASQTQKTRHEIYKELQDSPGGLDDTIDAIPAQSNAAAEGAAL